MKKLLFALFILMVSVTDARADAIGTWTIYRTYTNLSDVEYAGNKVFALSSGNIFAYNKSDATVQAYDQQTGLSGISVSEIEWCSAARKLLIIYDDKNIDIMDQDGRIANIADFAAKQMAVDKTINHTDMSGQFAYLSCAFGIVKIDMANEYIAETYNLGNNIVQTAVTGGYVFALTKEGGILRASTADNLNDKSTWKPFGKNTYTFLVAHNNRLIGFNNGTKAQFIDTVTGDVEDGAGTLWFNWLELNGNTIVCGSNDYVNVVTDDLSYVRYYFGHDVKGFSLENATPNSICTWMNDADNRLCCRTADAAGTVDVKVAGVKPDGIPINNTYHLAVDNSKVYVTAGMWSYPFGSTGTDGNVAMLSEGNWSLFENTGDVVTSGSRYRDVNTIVIDPRNHNHSFVSAYTGLYEFLDGKFMKRYGTADGLTTYDLSTTEYHLICTDMEYDKEGLLWILNTYVDKKPLCYMDSERKLHFISSDKFNGTATFVNDLEGLSHTDNYVWCVNAKTNYPALYRYNRNDGTVEVMKSFYNQDGTPLSISTTYSTAVDRQGNLWIATNAGPLYIAREDLDEMDITQHKVPRNDGTNYADYLLKNISTTVITPDLGNRKWIGTENHGIYVISNDCNTQIYNFTAENSPLLSNCIYDIKVNEADGKVYITTDKGLCVYQSDITEGNAELTDDNVYAYPNPVTPDYTGDITITGLEAGCYVKIVAISGGLVSEGEVIGGSYVWDGRNLNGNRVASGVYMVNVSKPDGSKGIVTRIAVVR